MPAGIYAKEALQKLGAWDTLSPKLAPAEDVRGALALVERNEAPLGIVYGSDAVASKGVKVVATFPEDSHKKVEYPVAVVEGHNNATVKAFYDYLKGPQAAEIFKRYGFTIKGAAGAAAAAMETRQMTVGNCAPNVLLRLLIPAFNVM